MTGSSNRKESMMRNWLRIPGRLAQPASAVRT
jgi:hypothetical protein